MLIIILIINFIINNYNPKAVINKKETEEEIKATEGKVIIQATMSFPKTFQETPTAP